MKRLYKTSQEESVDKAAKRKLRMYLIMEILVGFGLLVAIILFINIFNG